MAKLTIKQIPGLPTGRHADGDNLYLAVKGNSRRWVYRYQIAGKRNELSLGSFPQIALRDARAHSKELNAAQARGEDVRMVRNRILNKVETISTFEDCTKALIEIMRPEWSNKKHAQQWENTLATYAFPTIGRLPVNQITTNHIVAILTPIWRTKTETAQRVRQRVEKVLGWAKKTGKREGENPAAWTENLEYELAKPSRFKTVRHHPSLHWKQVPKFVADLRSRSGNIVLGTEVLILTASRFNMVRGARFSEFDFSDLVWTIPSERTKRKTPHRVPITPRLRSIVQAQWERYGSLEEKNGFVFPGQKSGKPLSSFDPAIDKSSHVWLDPNGEVITNHGFRASFSSWAAAQACYPFELAEHQLHHQVGNEVHRSYQRDDLLEPRREQMLAWEHFVLGANEANDQAALDLNAPSAN